MVKILLVEASQKIQKQMTDALVRVRFSVDSTQWAEEALALATRQRFDAVMIHDNLTDMPALDLIRNLRKQLQDNQLPVIIVYGKFDAKHRMEVWRIGADDVIDMPFVLPEVLLRLHVRLQKRGIVRHIPGSIEDIGEPDTAHAPEGLPCHGSIETRPLPVCLSILFLNKATGILRFIEGKHIRSYYFEKGYIRGTNSSKKEENFVRLMQKWLEPPGDIRKHLKSLSDTLSDREAAKTVRHLCGLQDQSIDALAVRYMHYVVQGSIHAARGEFDWSPDEVPEDMLLVSFRGFHPIHILMTVIRDTSPVVDYTPFIIGRDLYLAPGTRDGRLRNTYRMTAPEACVTALTAQGVTLGNWLKQAEIILPYASAFIYTMLQFRVFTCTERNELTSDEKEAVSLPEFDSPENLGTMIDSDEQVSDASALEEKEPGVESDPVMMDPTDETPAPMPKVRPVPTAIRSAGESIEYDSVVSGISQSQAESGKKPVMPSGEATISSRGTKESLAANRSRKTQLERELDRFTQQTTPHERYKPATTGSVPSREPRFVPDALEFFAVNRDRLANGHTWETHPALICIVIMQSQQTGILTFQDAASESRLYWQNGRLVYAKSTKPQLRIDQILFDLGMINADQKATANALWEESGGMRSGTMLFRFNIVNVMDLTEAVKEQIRLIMIDVCNIPAGDYDFKPGPLPQSEYIAFDVSTERLLVQGIREMDDLGNLQKAIPSLNVNMVQNTGAMERAQEMHLEGIDISILNRFRKANAIKSAYAGMDISLQSFKNTLAGLYLLNLLKIAL
ncbi:response regulator [bacterium]|nr:response regulator [candidate division CSSED10-310 bacterium]